MKMNRKWLLGLLLVLAIVLVAGVAGADISPKTATIAIVPGASEGEVSFSVGGDGEKLTSFTAKDVPKGINWNIDPTPSSDSTATAYTLTISAETGTELPKTAEFYYVVSTGTATNQDTVSITINQDDGIEITGVTLVDGTYTYDGVTQHKPAIDSVSVPSGVVNTPTPDDYNIEYGDNINAGTNAGSVTVIAKEGSSFKGRATAYFDIGQMTVTPSIEVTGTYTYDGSKKEATFNVSTEEGKNLVKDTDFTVTYGENINAGEGENGGSVTITSKSGSNYKFENPVTAYFTISPASISDAEVTFADTYTFDGSLQTGTATVKLGDKTLTLTDDYTISGNEGTNAGDYPVTVTGTGNYTGEATGTFTINKLSLENATVEVTTTDLVYNGADQTAEVSVTITAGSATLTPSDTDYTISDNKQANAGDYTLSITATESSTNYTGSKTGVPWSIAPKALSLDETKYTIDIVDDNEVFDYNPHTPAVSVTDLEITGTPKLTTADYDLSFDTNTNVNAGEDSAVAIIKGKGNYTGTIKPTFSIAKAKLTSLTLCTTESIYNQEEIEPDKALKVTGTVLIADSCNVNQEDYELTSDETMLDAKTYTVKVKLIGDNADNFEDPDAVSAEYTIKPAPLKELKFKEGHVIYKAAAYDPNQDPIKGDATLTATGNSDTEILTVDPADYKLSCSKDIEAVGTYTIVATATSTNYTTNTVSQTFDVWRKKVKELKLTVNGPEADTSRLGGPKADQYHTITLDAEPDELVIITVKGGDGAVITEIKDATAGDIEIKDGAINGVKLPDDTGDVKYTITAQYEDYDNLTNDEESATATPTKVVSENFYYDTVAKPVTVGQLMNRAATGVPVTLAEDYSKVTFTSSGAGENFTATSGLLRAGSHTIGFDNVSNPKLQSTTRYGSSYNGSATDLVGNTVAIPNQEIYQSTGTLLINSIDPAINGANKIGKQDSITLSVTMTAPGGHSELVSMTPGGGRTLTQGEQAITISADALGRDAYITPSVAFDDLIGSATFQSFVYDPQCDDPVLTSTLYGGCYILAGVVEPGSAIRAEIGGEFYRTNADAYGTFIISMPSTNSGDIVIIHVTDQAGNGTKKEFTVGEEEDPVKMTAFMQGKQYTNAHNAPDGTPLGFTNVLSVKPDDIKAGLVKLPIIAGNIVQVGEITLAMDDAGTLSYSYTLEDGVVVNSENMVLLKKLSAQDAIDLNGEPISKDGTVVPVNGNQPILLVGKFEVSVPAEMLESTFQTETVKDSELKKIYRDRQNNRPFK